MVPGRQVTATVELTSVSSRRLADRDALDVLESALKELLAEPGGRARLAAVLRYTVLARPELDVRVVADEFRRVAGPEAGEVVMSTAQELIDQGVQQGRLEERRELLEMLLREKFGKLARPVLDQLTAATADELHTWAKRIVTAKRIDDIFAPDRRTSSSRSRKK